MNRIHHADNKKDSAVPVLLSFSYSYVLLFTISVQAAGLVIPYVLGLSLHYKWLVLTYEKCTATHDFWPSISQVVSAFLPERYVGRMAMALISFPRIMDGIMYHQFFATRNLLLCQKLWYRSLIRLNSFFLIVHLLLFYSLMYISSAENADIHAYVWGLFIIFSVAHMVTFLITYRCGSHKPLTKKERLSLVLRAMILSVHVVAIILFIYYVAMHFFHCQVYALSIAAMSENCVAVSSLAFHAVELLDFHSLKYCVCWDNHLKIS